QADAVALDAEARAERAAALLDRQLGVVEHGRAWMPEFRCAPTWPRQAVDVALARPVGSPQRLDVEVLLIGHMQLQPLRRLAAVACGPSAAIDLAQDVLGRDGAVLDLDALEHPIREAELAREQVHGVVVVL